MLQTDFDLWELVKQGDEKAFSTLFHRYSPKIYSTAFSYIQDKEISEQIVHDIFIALWINRDRLEIKSFGAYLTAASRYKVYKYLAVSKKIRLDYKEDLDDLALASIQNAGYHNIVYNELSKSIDSGLLHLPKRCREIFIMSRKQFLTNDEIASKLGISKRSVENQITRALKHLRLILKNVPLFLIALDRISW